MSSMQARRMARELQLLSSAPPPGVAAWPGGGASGDEARMDLLDAEIVGAPETPYAGGVFRLRVVIPPEYPIKPPGVRFLTKIYHPNIDAQGRICLDTLNMPPKGAWKPSLNVATVLASVQLLMSHPNPDDGLMADITDEYRRFPSRFHSTAVDWTNRFARASAENTKASVLPAPAADQQALSPSTAGSASVASKADGSLVDNLSKISGAPAEAETETSRIEQVAKDRHAPLSAAGTERELSSEADAHQRQVSNSQVVGSASGVSGSAEIDRKDAVIRRQRGLDRRNAAGGVESNSGSPEGVPRYGAEEVSAAGARFTRSKAHGRTPGDDGSQAVKDTQESEGRLPSTRSSPRGAPGRKKPRLSAEPTDVHENVAIIDVDADDGSEVESGKIRAETRRADERQEKSQDQELDQSGAGEPPLATQRRARTSRLGKSTRLKRAR